MLTLNSKKHGKNGTQEKALMLILNSKKHGENDTQKKTHHG